MTDTHEAHRLAKLLSADPTESPVSLAASALLLRIPELEAENAAWRKQADTLTHQVICCGVAASHPDPELTKHGAYAGKWNSAQAEEVRKLRAERDQLRAELEKVSWQPIETAPKDGSEFLCWVSAVRYGETDEGQQYQQDASQVDFCQWLTQPDIPDCGWFDPCCGQIADQQYVTHWMPLPTAPTPPNADQKGQ